MWLIVESIIQEFQHSTCFRRSDERRLAQVESREKKGTNGRRSDVSPVVSFPPSFARTFSSRERRLGTRQPFPYTTVVV